MAIAGTAIFFDGVTSARRAVTVQLTADGVLIRDAQERDMLARWAYDQLDHLAAPEGVLRLGCVGAKTLARLEVRDAALAHAIDEASVPVDRSGATERRGRLKVVAWSLAATVSLVLAGVFGVPALANQLAPLVPLRVERLLGEAVDAEARKMLDKRTSGSSFECGAGPGEAAGRDALTRMTARLSAAAALPIPLDIKVVRRGEANAIALPGGRIYLFQGLVDKAERADELAGVIAHEVGHVANRDGTRSILQAAGLSFLFGMVLGDFVGGGAVVIGARAVLQSSYSREVESAADRYAVELMGRAGGDPRALGAVLTRLAGANHPGMDILSDHPDTKLRVKLIEDLAKPAADLARPTADLARPTAAPQSLLEPSEWAALKRICAGR
jgi:Zn-dependent protease with chaperone function